MTALADALAGLEGGTVWPLLAGILTGLAFDRALRVPLVACSIVIGGLGAAAWLALEPADWTLLGKAYDAVSTRLDESGFLSGMLAGKILAALLGGLWETKR
jgi:hypothetical protein